MSFFWLQRCFYKFEEFCFYILDVLNVDYYIIGVVDVDVEVVGIFEILCLMVVFVGC